MTLVFFYPQFKKLTGAERLILKLADYTARSLGDSTRVVLLTHRLADEVRPALGPGVHVVETGWPMQISGNHYLDAAVEYAFGPALAMRIPRRGLDGIIFFGPPSVPAMWFTRRLLFRAGWPRVPVLYFCFEPPRFIYRDTDDIVRSLGLVGALLRPVFALYRGVDRRMVRTADRVLSNSPFGSRKLWEAYRRRTTVIEHGVDFPLPEASLVHELRLRYGLQGRQVAVTVNHLHPRKRVDLFLRSVHHAAGRVPNVTALVVGGGPERENLERLASDLGMSIGRDVIFTGAVPEAELPAHYALGDVYLHTGREESFGLSVIEALSLGLPVVAVAEGGPCDTVQDGVSGYLVPADETALGEATAKLLLDRERAQRMGQAGARFVESQFSWEKGTRTLLRVLDRVKQRLSDCDRTAR
ncbi:MAG: glycosyltransferase family 4 protein [Chloroflexota bacterium]